MIKKTEPFPFNDWPNHSRAIAFRSPCNNQEIFNAFCLVHDTHK